MQVSRHRAQALIRRREAPGNPQRAAFTIRGCNKLTHSAHRAFNGAKGTHRLSNHDGLAFPSLSRHPRPAGSQPPFGVGQRSSPYPIHYRPAFACSGIPYPTIHRYALTGDFPRSLWVRSGLPRFAQAPFTEGLGPVFPPVVQHLQEVTQRHPLPDHAPFGSSLVASSACSLSRRLNNGSPELTIPSNPRSRPP